MKIISLVLALLCSPCAFFGQVNPQPFVIPSLQEWKGGHGCFRLNKNGNIRFDANQQLTKKVADILKKDLRETGLAGLKVSSGNAQKGDVIFKLLPGYDTAIKEEGYYFEVNDVVTVSANTYRGLFWGSRTLLQLLEQSKDLQIPQGRAIDYPKFPVRGFMIDAGRKYFTMDFLERYVKLLAYYKIGDFQVHLNDNGFHEYFGHNWDSTYSGFRLASETYPGLPTPGEFYTKRAFREFQLMAQDYGVTIIPEIDVPAHSLAFVKAIPEIGSDKYGKDHLDINNPKTYEVIENVFKEYLSGPDPVFVGKELHIGTDEYAKEEAESFRKFTDHFIKYVQNFGKDVRAWGALTHAKGNTPVTVKGVTLNMWYNGYADPIEMKKLGYKMISTPDNFLYIVPAAGYYYDYLNLPYLYKSWTPLNVGNVRFSKEDSLLLGGMFAVWNDVVGNGITAMDVHDRVFPALQVLSEKMWSSVTDTLNYKDFANSAKKIGEGPGLNMRGYMNNSDASSVMLNAVAGAFENEQKKPVYKVITSNVKAGAADARYANTLIFAGNSSYVQTPWEHIGYNYRVQFDINPVLQKANSILFNDPAWQTSVQLLPDGRLAYYRENYADTFYYKIPAGKWTAVAFEGDNKSVSLYINNHLEQRLTGYKIPKTAKDTISRVQTLFFPLKQIGSTANAFLGKIANLKIDTWRKKD